MGKNNRYRTRNNVGTTNIVKPPLTVTEQQEETLVANPPEVIEDNLTPKTNVLLATETTQAQESTNEVESDEEDAVVDEAAATPVFAVSSELDEDDKLVSALRDKLATFKEKLEGFGTEPKDFAYAAKAGSDVTKFVMKYPKPKVLDTLLAFFVENKDGVAAGINIMKGSTTLPATDEKALSVLFNLFVDLANRRVIAINPGFVNSVLKRPEIVNYYNRRREGIKANR